MILDRVLATSCESASRWESARAEGAAKPVEYSLGAHRSFCFPFSELHPSSDIPADVVVQSPSRRVPRSLLLLCVLVKQSRGESRMGRRDVSVLHPAFLVF